MLTIMLRELSSSLNSMLAYLATCVFLLLGALILFVYPDTSVLEFGYATMQTFFDTAPWILLLLVPALGMRLFAEERKSGTLELLYTRPLYDWQIIMGKYLSVCILIVIALVPTALFVFSIYTLASPPGSIDGGAIAGSYLGLFLIGAAFAAISLFTSSLTGSQVIAFLLAVVISYFFYSGIDSISHITTLGPGAERLSQAGIGSHYTAISRGVLDSRDLIYFCGFSLLFLLMTQTRLESRKW